MLINFKDFSKAIIPQIGNEEILLENKTFLEKLFFKILEWNERILNIRFEKRSGSTIITFFRDLLFVSILLETITQIIFLVPLLLRPEDPTRDMFSLQIVIITLFCSISWTGFVYLTDDFRNLFRDRILPVIKKEKIPSDSGFYTFIRQFFNGSLLKWQSGRIFRIYLRTVLFLLCFAPIFIITVSRYIQAVLQNLNPSSISMLIILILTLSLFAFFSYIITYILLTIFGIFFYLFMAVSSLEIEIFPLINMGGLQKFGDIIIHCIYLMSFGIASIPILFVLSRFRSIPTISINQFTSQSISNMTGIIQNNFVKSTSEISFNTIAQFSPFFFMFALFVIAALILITLLHYRIKQEKRRELDKIETLIQNINFFEVDEDPVFERNQYLLSLHEKIFNSYEWPIRKLFIIEIALAGIPLIISHYL